MPIVKFGRKNEPETRFEESDELIAVRTRSTRSLRSGPVLSSASAQVEGGDLVLAFPNAGVEVYRVPQRGGARRSVDDLKAALRRQPDVRFAGGVLVDPETQEPVVYTENLFIKFVDETEPETCEDVIRQAGLSIKRKVDYATNAYFVMAPEGTGQRVFDIALELLKRSDVEYCHPEIAQRRQMRAIAPQQWHLAATTIGGAALSASANVAAAHQITEGQGITIAIIDDGVDIDHPELSGNGKVVAPRDATQHNDNPRPKDDHPLYDDNHGTACAGVACANGNGGASGVAPKAKLLPIRLASGLGSQDEADAFKWAADHGADVISCSWGPADGDWSWPGDPIHNKVVALPASTKLAIDYVTAHGRNGKGCVVLFAAGNGRESVENDGYASYDRVIAVAACNDHGKRSVYSDFGPSVWCSFPSSDFEFDGFQSPAPLTPGIWTTDRTGSRGYNRGSISSGDLAGNFTNDFGGTSSACPGAAGVAALVLAVNPELPWQEVREVLRKSCDRIDPSGGAYNANNHSSFYGYGRLNAGKAVEIAQPQPRNSVTISRDFNQPLPDLQTVAVSLDVGETEALAALSVVVDIRHTYIGDLTVTLETPLASAPIILHSRKGGATRNLQKTFDRLSVPALANAAGKSPKGRWTLRVKDSAFRDEGTLVRFGLELSFPTAQRSIAETDGEAASVRAPKKPAKLTKRPKALAAGRQNGK